MFTGRLLAIAMAPDAAEPMELVEQAEAVAGKGLEGDRYALVQGAFQKGQNGQIEPKQEVSLIEREAIEAASARYNLQITHLVSRRNLLTENVPLNHLVGKTFTIGDVTLRGVKLCEPCEYLEQHTFPGILEALLHRGGLRAQVISGGTLREGDAIQQAE